MNLEQVFEKELLDNAAQAQRDFHYSPTIYIQMIQRMGAVSAAKWLIADNQKRKTPASGLITLARNHRLDLSMEHTVCKPEYAELFTDTEIAACQRTLASLTR